MRPSRSAPTENTSLSGLKKTELRAIQSAGKLEDISRGTKGMEESRLDLVYTLCLPLLVGETHVPALPEQSSPAKADRLKLKHHGLPDWQPSYWPARTTSPTPVRAPQRYLRAGCQSMKIRSGLQRRDRYNSPSTRWRWACWTEGSYYHCVQGHKVNVLIMERQKISAEKFPLLKITFFFIVKTKTFWVA